MPYPIERRKRWVEEIDKLLALFGPNGEHWTWDAYARLADGQSVHSFHSEAVSFCFRGALNRLYFDSLADYLNEEVKVYKQGCLGLITWNDDYCQSFADIKRFLEMQRAKLAA